MNVVTSGTWVALESGAKAQSAGTITIRDSSIFQNGTIPTDLTITNRRNIPSTITFDESKIVLNRLIPTDSTTNRRDISDNPTNSGSNGASIIMTTSSLKLDTGAIVLVKKVPEPSFVGGILAVAVAGSVSRLKRKRK